MGKIWVKELTGGLDVRRMPVATTGAVLMEATNGHITRGGEFEKREAFVHICTLPNNTVGLAATSTNLIVFGSRVAPSMPSQIAYQRLQDPVPSRNNDIYRVRSHDLFAGKLFVSAEFAVDDRYMFYDGDYVESWADGYARARFTVDANEITEKGPAQGSVRLTPGASPSGTEITQISIRDVDLLGAPVTYATSFNATLNALVSAINARTGITGFSASLDGWFIRLTGPIGTEFNGEGLTVTLTGALGASDYEKMNGGTARSIPRLTKLWVGKQKLIDASVAWTTDAEDMADDIVDAINAYTATSGWEASAQGRTVTITSDTAGSEFNGLNITYEQTNGFTMSDRTQTRGGRIASLPRGTYVKAVENKMYAVSDSVLYFSGIAAPTEWSTDAVGAGFIDVSAEISGGEKLKAVAKYQNQLAIFGEDTVIIEYVDPDPTLNRQVQVLERTGTIAPQSVAQFGDRDIYYLDQTGLRSLQARDASNAAATTDIGVMIDKLLLDKLRTFDESEKAKIIGVIEPQEGRFWLIMKNQIFVLSYFPGSKVSGWTTYNTTYFDDDNEEVSFNVDAAVVFNKRLYLRAGNEIFAYGGGLSNQVYDKTTAVARLPYLDAGEPARLKNWNGIDAAARGDWAIRIGMDPRRENVLETVSKVQGITYGFDKLPVLGNSTHISVEFKATGDGRAVLSSCVIHYEGDDVEDR